MSYVKAWAAVLTIYAIVVTVALLTGHAGAVTVPGPPPITVQPPTSSHCVSEDVSTTRAPDDPDNLTGDWEQDVSFDCGGQPLIITLDASTIRLLAANAEAH